MRCTLDSINSLPELPLEVFELSGKLGYSEIAPVLTIKPYWLPLGEGPAGAAPRPDRSSFAIKEYVVFVYYPLVNCHLATDESVVASLRMDDRESGSVGYRTDIGGVSRARRYYKLSRFGRDDWVCIVNFGPHGADVVEQETCDGTPSLWTLSAAEPDILLEWRGKWEDIPSFPNLFVGMDSRCLCKVTRQCCPGFTLCPTTMSCLPNQSRCPDPIPA